MWYNVKKPERQKIMAKKQKPEITKVCRYCELAAPLSDGETLLCQKKGVVSAGHVCRKFKYDLLKRTPAPPVSVGRLELPPEDDE